MKVKKIVGVIVLVVLLIGLAAYSTGSRTTEPKPNGLKVVAAENFWGNIASQIGANHVQVTSIITDPTADPHLYESNANNASAISSADVVIINGLGYDDFMSKLLNASQSPKRQVLTASDILGVRGATTNPHLWYDIPKVHIVAAQIAASFAAKDAAHTVDYQNNLKKFDASLQPILDTISQIKAKYSGSPVAYTEQVPGYLLAAASLSIKTPASFAKSIQDGNEPSPADTTTMDDLMTNRRVRVLLYNSQATSAVTEHVKDLAKQAGVPVIGATETLPTNEKTYQSWQQHQLDLILNALETNR